MKQTIVLFVLLPIIVIAQNIEYVGSSSCKMCHNKDAKGAQYTKWKSSSHAGSFETLKSDKAVQIANEKGIKGNAWEVSECLTCHTTGFGKDGYEIKDESFWTPNVDDKLGNKAVKRMMGLQSVGCESCHGAGNKYKSKKIMVAVYTGEIDGSTVGLERVDEETCIVCHNDSSPTFKPFNFEERIEKIGHSIPGN